MIGIKRVKRVAVAVKDLDQAIENWKGLFGIKPFMRGDVPEDKYSFCAFHIGQDRGDDKVTIEFLSPLNDPDTESLIGKFIEKRGEGLYMITLETIGSSDDVDIQLEETGLEGSWGGHLKQWVYKPKSVNPQRITSWTEHYISPKDANGVLCTLASIEYMDPECVDTKNPGVTLTPKKRS
jgi:hypothetical protein